MCPSFHYYQQKRDDWCWLEVQSSKICSRKELADPALNLLAARTHPLCVRWLTGGEEEEWVLWALKGVGVVWLGKLLSSFPVLFSCCLPLALVTPTKITNHVHTYLGSFQRKVDYAASSLCANIVLFLNKSHLFSWVSEPHLWEQWNGSWAS